MFEQRSTALTRYLYYRIEIITSNIIVFCKPQPRSRFLQTKFSVSDAFIITLSYACLIFISPWTTRLRFMSPSLVTSLNKMWVGVFEVVPSRDGRQGSLLPGPPSKVRFHKQSASKCENSLSVFILV